jgi:hypothetical protein
MGKYSSLRGKLPAFVEKPEYQQRVDEAKQELLGTLEGENANVNRLAALFAEYEAKKAALYATYGKKSEKVTDVEYELNIYRKALSQLLQDAMENENMNFTVLDSGLKVKLDDLVIPVVKDKSLAVEWALENMPELLTITFKGLNAKQFKSLLVWAEKQKLEAGIDFHDQKMKTVSRDRAVQGLPSMPGVEPFFMRQAKLSGGVNGSSSDE